MNKVTKSIFLITLCTALGLPLVGYAKCDNSLELTLTNNSSHDLTISNPQAPCGCASVSDSMYASYPSGSVLKAGQTWTGVIYVDTGDNGPLSSCFYDDTSYDADFLDSSHGNTPVIHYHYHEKNGGYVDQY
ncbi:MAG: hypothetical protein JSR33_11655, partial [Proteobacteria bacterium]|nr:hypothetical protein [Pseudomonadota bacterium]